MRTSWKSGVYPVHTSMQIPRKETPAAQPKTHVTDCIQPRFDPGMPMPMHVCMAGALWG